MENEVAKKIEKLDRELDANATSDGYFQRGLLHRQAGDFGKAMNDFLAVLKLDPENRNAEEHLKQLRDIFEFRNLDMYNP